MGLCHKREKRVMSAGWTQGGPRESSRTNSNEKLGEALAFSEIRGRKQNYIECLIKCNQHQKLGNTKSSAENSQDSPVKNWIVLVHTIRMYREGSMHTVLVSMSCLF